MRRIKEFAQLFESQQELTQEQKDWLDECTYCTDSNWWINPQTGLVDVDGSFDCEELGLSDFKGVRFGSVEDYFDCRDNQLTSLEGAPRRVGVNFYCQGNQLTSLEGAPQRVGGDFDCEDNQLTSLEGAPEMIGGDLFCSGNAISETAIARVLRRMRDNTIPLEIAVREIWDDIAEEDRIYLAKHHPNLPPEEKREYAALERHNKRLI